MITVGMSTSCVYPLGIDDAFRLARSAGFGGIEVMVTNDPKTQDAAGLLSLSREYSLPILSVHAPVLLRSQLVWGGTPRAKLERSAALARDVGASTVVVHPPFFWQGGYARRFVPTVRAVAAEYGVSLAVENMFPWKVGPLRVRGYSPGFDPSGADFDAMTLDFSHASLSGRDSLDLALAMGSRLRHVHLCDGTGAVDSSRVWDEHLVPGHGHEPVADVLHHLGRQGWTGAVIAEIHITDAKTDDARLELLRETVAFAREHLGRSAGGSSAPRGGGPRTGSIPLGRPAPRRRAG
jgi:sugar phosphate isomerase/epimerase